MYSILILKGIIYCAYRGISSVCCRQLDTGQPLIENKLHLNLKCSSTLITVMLLYLYMAAQTLTRGHSITKHTSLLLMHDSKSNTEEKSGLHDLQPQGTRSRKKQKCLSFIFEKKKSPNKKRLTQSSFVRFGS